MGRRANLRGVLNEDVTSDGDSFLNELDAATYGKLGAISSSRIVAEGYLISELQPDPQQPRRVLPSVVRQMVDIHDMRATMDRWYHTAERELERSIPLRDLVEGKVEDGQFDTEGITHDRYPVAASFLGVTRLAGDILRDGLINPISIYRHGRTHMINKGERRWFAYHILYGLYGSQYERIPAREESPSIWAQASENMSREDLGGVALARQFALLLMSLYPDQEWGSVTDFTTDEGSDRLFYAQMEDGDVWRIPKNNGQKIADAMQASVNSLRHYRQILGVPDVIWLEADDKKWSTGRLREWITETNKKNNPRPFQRKETPTPPATDNHTVSTDTVSDKDDGYRPLTEEERKQASSDLPPHHTLANIDTGEGANVAIPQDEMSARAMRYSSLVLPFKSIEDALARLLEIQSITILREEDVNKRLDLMYQMANIVTHVLLLAEQLVDSFGRKDAGLALAPYELIDEQHRALVKLMRQQAGVAGGDAEAFRNGVTNLLENIIVYPHTHISERMALMSALAVSVVDELSIIQVINGTLNELDQLKYVESHLGEIDNQFWKVVNELKDRIGGA